MYGKQTRWRRHTCCALQVSSPGGALHPAAAAVKASKSPHPTFDDDMQPASTHADELNQYFMASAGGLARTGSGSFYMSPASSLGAPVPASNGMGEPLLGPRFSASFNNGVRTVSYQAPPSAPTAGASTRSGRSVAASVPGTAMPSGRSRLSRVASQRTARGVHGPAEDPDDDPPERTLSNSSRRPASFTGAVSGADGPIIAVNSATGLLQDRATAAARLVPSDTTTATAVTAQLYAAAAAVALGSGTVPEFSGEVVAMGTVQPVAGARGAQQGAAHGRGAAGMQPPHAAVSAQHVEQRTGSSPTDNAAHHSATSTLAAPTPHSFSSLLPWPGWLTQSATFGRRALLQVR